MTSEGADHVVRPSGTGSVLRRRKPDGDGLSTADEAVLLAAVAAQTPIPVPAVLRVWPDDDAMEQERVDGVPLSSLLDTDPSLLGSDRALGWARALAGFQHALAALDVAELGIAVPVDDTAPADLLDEARETAEAVRDELAPGTSAAVTRFLDLAPPAPAARLVLCHADLGAEHVFVDPATGAITGVIDWSDAAITDPALDLGLLLRDLGPSAFTAVVAEQHLAADVVARARFHARVRALEDLAYGLERRDAYLRNALRATTWLFDGDGATADR